MCSPKLCETLSEFMVLDPEHHQVYEGRFCSGTLKIIRKSDNQVVHKSDRIIQDERLLVHYVDDTKKTNIGFLNAEHYRNHCIFDQKLFVYTDKAEIIIDLQNPDTDPVVTTGDYQYMFKNGTQMFNYCHYRETITRKIHSRIALLPNHDAVDADYKIQFTQHVYDKPMMMSIDPPTLLSMIIKSYMKDIHNYFWFYCPDSCTNSVDGYDD